VLLQNTFQAFMPLIKMNLSGNGRGRLFFVTAGAEGVGIHLCFLILSKPFAAWSVADKAIPEFQRLMHIYHLGVLAVTDIARISRGIGDKHHYSGDNGSAYFKSHAQLYAVLLIFLYDLHHIAALRETDV